MAAITDYASLKAAIATKLIRTDLTTEIVDWVSLAEARLNRECGQQETSVELSASSQKTALPADCDEVVSLHLKDTHGLEPMSVERLYASYAGVTSGEPLFYAIEGSNIVLGPSPGGTYTLVLLYRQKLDVLSDANTTNWIIDSHPDLYFQAVLKEAYEFLRNPEAEAKAEARTRDFIRAINTKLRRQRFSGGRIKTRVPVTV